LAVTKLWEKDEGKENEAIVNSGEVEMEIYM
jgi:hypothetical protein